MTLTCADNMTIDCPQEFVCEAAAGDAKSIIPSDGGALSSGATGV
jgi:hypothetical protein